MQIHYQFVNEIEESHYLYLDMASNDSHSTTACAESLTVTKASYHADVEGRGTATSCLDGLFQDDDHTSESPAGPSSNTSHTSQGLLVDDMTTPMSDISQTNRNGRPSNLELSKSERSAKRILKKHLKQRTKLRKYETRLQQAVSRQDKGLEERAQKEWNEYVTHLKADCESIINFKPPTTTTSSMTTDAEPRPTDQQSMQIQPRRMDERETERVSDGRRWIVRRWQDILPTILHQSDKLLRTDDMTCDSGNITRASMLRVEQTKQARDLLQNMTKGTQTEGMFTNELALAGYARQKFVERAVLAFATLDRLDPTVSPTKLLLGSGTSVDINVSFFWERLKQIKQVWSIGCGPGCDAFGILAFLESHALKLDDGILLMDFVIDQWKSVILNELIPNVSPRYVPTIKTELCDVRYSLKTNPVNAAAMKKLEPFLRKSSRCDVTRCPLVVVSYLLTETRHQWKAFFFDLLTELQGTQTLLLLIEPTAWQLHDFLKLFKDEFLKAYIWLDSSRDTPHLQSLEARLGPAILMGCTN